jgi:hypothetical protein
MNNRVVKVKEWGLDMTQQGRFVRYSIKVFDPGHKPTVSWLTLPSEWDVDDVLDHLIDAYEPDRLQVQWLLAVPFDTD